MWELRAVYLMTSSTNPNPGAGAGAGAGEVFPNLADVELLL